MPARILRRRLGEESHIGEHAPVRSRHACLELEQNCWARQEPSAHSNAKPSAEARPPVCSELTLTAVAVAVAAVRSCSRFRSQRAAIRVAATRPRAQPRRPPQPATMRRNRCRETHALRRARAFEDDSRSSRALPTLVLARAGRAPPTSLAAHARNPRPCRILQAARSALPKTLRGTPALANIDAAAPRHRARAINPLGPRRPQSRSKVAPTQQRTCQPQSRDLR